MKTPRMGLSAKLVLLVIVGILTAFSIIGCFRVYAEKQRSMDDMMQTGQERAGLIAVAVANMLVGYDYSNMESLLDRIALLPDVMQVTIRNREGKIMVTRSNANTTGGADLSFSSPVMLGNEGIGSVELRLSRARVNGSLNATYRSIIIEQVFSGIFLGLLIYFAASRVIVRPVQRIGQHMKSAFSNDELAPPERLDIPGSDEIGELARIFNRLNERVYETQHRLHEKIDMTGTALMHTNEELQLRSQELESRTRELEKSLALVEKLAVTDSLTELHNRRYFDDALFTAFSRAQRYGELLCLVLLDVDYFKQINDVLGHGAGDAALQSLGKLIKSSVRESDISARLGGDEFALMLFLSSKEDAEKWAKNLLSLLTTPLLEFGGTPIKMGLSIGIASNEDAANSIEALYGAADEALYEAKRRGRNRVVTYPFADSHETAGYFI